MLPPQVSFSPPSYYTETVSTNRGVNQRSKYVTQVQQQRPESPGTLTKYINSTRGTFIFILKQRLGLHPFIDLPMNPPKQQQQNNNKKQLKAQLTSVLRDSLHSSCIN